MKLIAALSTLGIVASAAASGNGHHSLRHDRSLQVIACPDDVKECEDGSFVDRDADVGCEFRPCPNEIACAANVQECADGSYVSRDPANGCAFRPCPDEIACAADVQECGDGSFVSRDPAKDCAFKACPKACTGEDGETYMAPCEGSDGMFCIGESYTALDGCNTCSCANMDGLAACTMKFCLPDDTDPEVKDDTPATCLVNGIKIDAGEKYIASDGCNTCTCSGGDRPDACTMMACEPCTTCDGDDGNTYCAGEAFLSGDGCNTCRCSDNGTTPCTKMACPSSDEPAPATCVVDGIEYAEGETYTASDGCNTCTCSVGSGPDACTRMVCPEVVDDSPGVTTNGGGGSTVEDDTTSGAISASVGLSAIVAMASFLGAVMN